MPSSQDSLKIPTHLSIILDGNRRWAKENGLSPAEGHRQGYENLKLIGKATIRRGVKYLSVFGFSTENWQRKPSEVKHLMSMAYQIATNDLQEFNQEDIRIVWLGRMEGLSQRLVKALQKAEKLTAKNSRGTLAICFNYGGQQEIVDAAKDVVKRGIEITQDAITKALYMPELPAVDLMVRTAGEKRLSNFMTWRAAYAELYFSDKLWPDFSEADLDKALKAYANRKRRFGS